MKRYHVTLYEVDGEHHREIVRHWEGSGPLPADAWEAAVRAHLRLGPKSSPGKPPQSPKTRG